MIRTVWLNGMAVGTVQRLGYESGMQGQYSYLVASWLDPDRQGATAPSYSYAPQRRGGRGDGTEVLR